MSVGADHGRVGEREQGSAAVMRAGGEGDDPAAHEKHAEPLAAAQRLGEDRGAARRHDHRPTAAHDRVHVRELPVAVRAGEIGRAHV